MLWFSMHTHVSVHVCLHLVVDGVRDESSTVVVNTFHCNHLRWRERGREEGGRGREREGGRGRAGSLDTILPLCGPINRPHPLTCPGNNEQVVESGISSRTVWLCSCRDLTGPSSRQERALRWPSPSHTTRPV